jgi:hypothetical protein
MSNYIDARKFFPEKVPQSLKSLAGLHFCWNGYFSVLYVLYGNLRIYQCRAGSRLFIALFGVENITFFPTVGCKNFL